MKVLKGYVKNRSRLKCCIAECYLSEEYTLFYSKYFKQASKIIDKIKCNASCVSNTLKWFAHGPRDLVMSFNGYIINGLRFHTKEAKKSRQNSGVLVEATTLCRSSARDNTQILGQVAYYGLKVNQPVKVDFNLHGQTIDSSSITLALHIGILAREHVPITLESWKKVDEQKKDMIWSSLLVRFILFFNILKKISFLVFNNLITFLNNYNIICSYFYFC
ncbi:hypothetical protein ACOSP7_016910 [Xanthoceras sorbifolium]